MTVTQLDGRGFSRFVAAGTYFLRKYRGVLDDLNVFPVPDGDTGSNMYLTAKAGMAAARAVRGRALSEVAAAAAHGSLLGARGNSGVILSQMLRGFAHGVRHRDVDRHVPARACDARGGRRGARRADEARRGDDPVGRRCRRGRGVPAGGARARLLPSRERRAARGERRARPHARPAARAQGGRRRRLRAARGSATSWKASCASSPRTSRARPRFRAARCDAPRSRGSRSSARTASARSSCSRTRRSSRSPCAMSSREHGDSLLVIGRAPTIKVHVHTAEPETVRSIAAKHGDVTRVEARGHGACSTSCWSSTRRNKTTGSPRVVPGAGFDRIARELGADVTIPVPANGNPSVRDLLVGVNASLANDRLPTAERSERRARRASRCRR